MSVGVVVEIVLCNTGFGKVGGGGGGAKVTGNDLSRAKSQRTENYIVYVFIGLYCTVPTLLTHTHSLTLRGSLESFEPMKRENQAKEKKLNELSFLPSLCYVMP